jgi:hypothetical protein
MKNRNFKSRGIALSIFLSAAALLVLQLCGGETYGEQLGWANK